MFDVFKQKKVEQNSAALDPPSSLPELAKDLYEIENKLKSEVSESPKQSIALEEKPKVSVPKIELPRINAKTNIEPSHESVPQLDMNLLRQFKSVMDEYRKPETQQQKIQQSSIGERYADNTWPSGQEYQLPNYNYDLTKLDSGFFKEFQEFVLKTDISDVSKRSVIEEMLSKDLINKMAGYHDNRSEGLPFYLSTTELNNATRHTFEELRSLEHSWLINKQKFDLLAKINTVLETDMRLKSEELKKLLSELLKRTSEPGKTSLETPASTGSTVKPGFVVESSKYFYLHDGRTLKSIHEFVEALKTMDDYTFSHHVTVDRNDFANWISGVFGEIALASQVRSINDRTNLLIFMLKNKY